MPNSPRTCPSQDASLCTYDAWFARPDSVHPKAILRLALSDRCVEALLRFRMGSHNLPCAVGRMQGVARAQRICTLCDSAQPGDEQHLVFSAQHCRHSGTSIRVCLGSMQLQWSSSYGRKTCVQWHHSSGNAWMCTMTLGLMRHSTCPSIPGIRSALGGWKGWYQFSQQPCVP